MLAPASLRVAPFPLRAFDTPSARSSPVSVGSKGMSVSLSHQGNGRERTAPPTDQYKGFAGRGGGFALWKAHRGRSVVLGGGEEQPPIENASSACFRALGRVRKSKAVP